MIDGARDGGEVCPLACEIDGRAVCFQCWLELEAGMFDGARDGGMLMGW
ncbi:hypothetical protein [Bartonella sp. WD16.2]|nr:hypothetical protein [Bartonella sp. WD16.2]AQX20412.1 hypothetical protein BWD162_013230 [Bartonella sp. WD16.2]